MIKDFQSYCKPLKLTLRSMTKHNVDGICFFNAKALNASTTSRALYGVKDNARPNRWVTPESRTELIFVTDLGSIIELEIELKNEALHTQKLTIDGKIVLYSNAETGEVFDSVDGVPDELRILTSPETKSYVTSAYLSSLHFRNVKTTPTVELSAIYEMDNMLLCGISTTYEHYPLDQIGSKLLPFTKNETAYQEGEKTLSDLNQFLELSGTNCSLEIVDAIRTRPFTREKGNGGVKGESSKVQRDQRTIDLELVAEHLFDMSGMCIKSGRSYLSIRELGNHNDTTKLISLFSTATERRTNIVCSSLYKKEWLDTLSLFFPDNTILVVE